mgnify:FL=1
MGRFASVGCGGLLVHDAGQEFFGDGSSGLVGVEALADEPAGDGHADDGGRKEAERRVDHADGGAVGDAALFPQRAEGIGLPRALRIAVGYDHADEFAEAVSGCQIIQPDHRAADEGLGGKADCPDQRLPHAPAHDFLGRIFLIAARACQQKRNVADVEGVEQEPVKAAARDLPFSYFKPARGNDGKADQSADDAGGDQIVLKQFDFCAQQGADEQHQRKEAEKDEIFKTASHDKTPSLRLTRAFESAEPMRALSGRLCLQAVFHKKRINKFRLLCVKDLPKSVICHYTETKQYHVVFIDF